MKLNMLPVLLVLSLPVTASEPVSDVEQRCADAEALRKQAAGLDYEWTTIAPLLQEARAALAADDPERADQLCEEARLQADQANQQAAREAANWRDAAPW